MITAHGEGLKRAFEDQVATFYVDSRGQRGDLVVQVDGEYQFLHRNFKGEGKKLEMNIQKVPYEVEANQEMGCLPLTAEVT